MLFMIYLLFHTNALRQSKEQQQMLPTFTESSHHPIFSSLWATEISHSWFICLMKLSGLQLGIRGMSQHTSSVICGMSQRLNETYSFRITETQGCKVGHFSHNRKPQKVLSTSALFTTGYKAALSPLGKKLGNQASAGWIVQDVLTDACF